MSSTTTPAVTPRRNGDPEVDLTGYRLVHRALVADTRAIADLADQVAGGTVGLSPIRAGALHGYVARLCSETRALHLAEGRHLWPVVAASAGSAVDLSGLTDDHEVIDPLLARCRSSAAALRTGPDDRDAACRLAGAATDLTALLAEHAEEEERELFPALRRFVSVSDFAAAEARLRRDLGVRRLGWLLPWLAHHSTADEVARALGGRGGRRARLLLAVGGPRFRRGRRTALG